MKRLPREPCRTPARRDDAYGFTHVGSE
jgi:hypothetical protein